MHSSNSELIRMMVQDAVVGTYQESYYPVKLTTDFDIIDCRYYQVPDAKHGALWVGGVGGSWDTPAKGLYPRLCEHLTTEAIASLRVRYRYPADLKESVLDVLSGISYLQSEGIETIALIGHSFGGAVVIQAAAQAEVVYTVVALATQSFGTNSVAKLSPHCSILLLHGMADSVLSPLCSQLVYSLALEPKKLILYPGASHSLNEVEGEVYQAVKAQIIEQLNYKQQVGFK